MDAGTDSWPVTLVAVLGSLYAIVMLTLLIKFVICRKQSAPQVAEMYVGMIHDGPRVSSEPVFKMSGTVQRGRSAFFAGSTTPGFDLQAIERQVRMAFVRKVYTLLTTQLLLTVGVVVLFIYLSFPTWKGCTPLATTLQEYEPCETMSQFGFGLLTNAWVIWAAFVPLIVMICFMHSVKNRYPLNYVVLLLFTLIESVTIAILCVMYFAAGFGTQILLAFAITMGIFLALTLFTMQSKVDWGFLGPGLCAALFVMLFWGWMTFWLVPYISFAFSQMYSLFGAILFTGFIVYDTNNIMRHFGVDDWLIAAIELYLDVINLFLFLLQLLSGSARRS